jgi:SAM-dependent methyltransferase
MTARAVALPPVPALAAPIDTLAPDAAAVAALNRTHDMAGLRARGGRVVRAIEERRRRLVAARVLRARPRVVVDVGCEDGWLAEAYASRVGRTVLVDLDPAMLERARARALPRTTTVVADAAAPSPLPRGCADVVILSAVLEHVARPADVLASWSGALVEGGRFIVFVPADAPILACKRVLAATRLARLVAGLSTEPAPGHVVTFRRATLARLLNPFGAVEEIGFDPAVLGYVATVRVGDPAAVPSPDGDAGP